MVLKNKKAFIKTIEAILAVLFVSGLFSQISQRSSSGTREAFRSPSSIGFQIINLLDSLDKIKSPIEDFDITALESKISLFMPDRINFKTKMEYTSFITVSSDDEKNYSVIYFPYNFPDYLDTNSVQIFLDRNIYNINTKWNWFYKLVSIKNIGGTIINKSYSTTIKLQTSKEPLNETSLGLFIDDEEVPINCTNIQYISTNNKTALAIVEFVIPFLKQGGIKTAYLFYAEGFTPYNVYTSISGYTSTSGVITSSGDSLQSKRADIFLAVPSLKNDSSKFSLKYSIGSTKTMLYNLSLNNSFNSDNIAVTFAENKPKTGTAPSYKTSSGDVYTVKRVFPINKNDVELSMDLWYKW